MSLLARMMARRPGGSSRVVCWCCSQIVVRAFYGQHMRQHWCSLHGRYHRPLAVAILHPDLHARAQ